MKRNVTVTFPTPTRVDYTPEGAAVVTMNVTVTEIEDCPLNLTEGFREFCRRTNVPEVISCAAYDAASRAFYEEFTKQSVMQKLRVTVED